MARGCARAMRGEWTLLHSQRVACRTHTHTHTTMSLVARTYNSVPRSNMRVFCCCAVTSHCAWVIGLQLCTPPRRATVHSMRCTFDHYIVCSDLHSAVYMTYGLYCLLRDSSTLLFHKNPCSPLLRFSSRLSYSFDPQRYNYVLTK